jgi:hypothetical protein
MTDQEKMQKAIEALLNALPEGKRLELVAFRPQVGIGDIEAGTVQAFMIADSDEDLKRADQIIEKGIHAAQNEYGLTAHFQRNNPRPTDNPVVAFLNKE